MRRRVMVIGAGFAGCMAAHDLDRAGFEVELLEARERVGGRVWSHRFEDGLVAELGAELIEDWYSIMLDVAAERGLAFTDGPQRVRRFPFFDRGRRIDEPSDEVILGAVTDALERLGLLVGDAASDPLGATARKIDRMTVADGLDAIALGGVPRRWFEALISGWSCREPEEESLLHFSLRRALPQLQTGFSQPRWGRRLVGGNDQIARILVEPLGERLRLGALVRGIEWSRGRVTASYERGGESLWTEADACVVAVPPEPLSRISVSPSLPDRVRAYGDLLGGCGAKVVVRHRPDLAPDPVFLSREPRFHGWRSGDQEAGGAATMYLGGSFAQAIAAAPAARARRLALDWLAQAYPATARSAADVVVAGWCAEPLTVTCGPVFPPGLMTTAVSPSPAQVDGALFFAGEHTSPDRFGSMEGALETGRRAAAEVMEALLT